MNYLDKESPEFLTEDKIPKIIDVFLEKSHPYFFLWTKEDLEKYKGINANIESIEDINKANEEEFKKIVDGFFESALANDDMLQIFFDACDEMELDKVKETYKSIFSNLLERFKESHSIYYSLLTAYYTGLRVSELISDKEGHHSKEFSLHQFGFLSFQNMTSPDRECVHLASTQM